MLTPIEKTCEECEKVIELRVDLADYRKYLLGAPVQDAFPYLNDGEREMFISSICSQCFDRMFLNF